MSLMDTLHLWRLPLVGFGLIFPAMTVAAMLSARWKNAGVVDVLWAGGFVVLALLYAFLGEGDFLRRYLMAGMVILANGRLAWHLINRFRHEFPIEDRRYHQLRLDWDQRGWKTDWLFFGLFQFQGVMMVILSLPFALASLNTSPVISWQEWLALGIWLIGWTGEMVADNQLKVFKSKPENHGQVCQAGLWAISRHPNYFFEWLLWCAYFIFAAASPHGWTTFYAPVVMLYFLTRVTGIAATEAQAVKSKGELYRRYQENTSAFIPWFKLKRTESI